MVETAQKRMEEQIRAKELEHKLEIQERDHKLEILEKDLRARELETKSTLTFDVDPPDRLKSSNISTCIARIVHPMIEQKHKWRDLGSKFGFSKESMDEIESSVRQKKNPAYYKQFTDNQLCHEYMNEMLSQWLDSYPGDSRGSKSFATYTWLMRALVEAGMGACARDLPDYNYITCQ